ncbi:hypothetical protein N9230_06205, partial [Akkermansiaceae bacterium]|nr:hypothetical protein [Akkermansiaceae bacterium]
ELTVLLDRQRGEIDKCRGRLKNELSPIHLLKQSVHNNPTGWFLGSLGTATLASFLLRRPKVVVQNRKRRGLLFSALKMGFSAARPALSAWLIARKGELGPT